MLTTTYQQAPGISAMLTVLCHKDAIQSAMLTVLCHKDVILPAKEQSVVKRTIRSTRTHSITLLSAVVKEIVLPGAFGKYVLC